MDGSVAAIVATAGASETEGVVGDAASEAAGLGAGAQAYEAVVMAKRKKSIRMVMFFGMNEYVEERGPPGKVGICESYYPSL